LFKSIVVRNTLATIAVASIAVAIMLAASYYLFDNRNGLQLNQKLTNLLDERKSHILSYLELEEAKISQLAKRGSLIEALQSYNSKKISSSDFRYQADNELAAIVKRNPGYQSLSIVDLQGMIIASSNEKEVGKLIENIAEGGVENNFFIFSQKQELKLLTPFIFGNKTQALLILTRNSNALNEIVSKPSPQASILLGNPKNIFLPQVIQNSKSELKRPKNNQTWNAFFHQGILSKDSVYQANDENGEPLLVSTTSLGYKDWILATKMNKSSAMKSVFEYLVQMAAIGMLSLALCFLLSFLLSRRIFSRLFELIDVTEQIKSGALYARSNSKGVDEIAMLSNSINQITESLEKEVLQKKSEREREIVSLDFLAEQAFHKVKEVYDSKRVSLELVTSNSELESWVVKDELLEILSRLLKSSLSYSEEGSTVVIRACEDEQGNATIVIKDWNGFSNEHREIYRQARSVISDFGGDLQRHSKRGGVNSVSLVFLKADQQNTMLVNS